MLLKSKSLALMTSLHSSLMTTPTIAISALQLIKTGRMEIVHSVKKQVQYNSINVQKEIVVILMPHVKINWTAIFANVMTDMLVTALSKGFQI